MLTKEEKQIWFDAILSGKFKKDPYYLGDEKRGTNCCLGVFCKINDIEFIPVNKMSPDLNEFEVNAGVYEAVHCLLFDKEFVSYNSSFWSHHKNDGIWILNTEMKWGKDFVRELDLVLPGEKVYDHES